MFAIADQKAIWRIPQNCGVVSSKVTSENAYLLLYTSFSISSKQADNAEQGF
jgi:hypothetical protein